MKSIHNLSFFLCFFLPARNRSELDGSFRPRQAVPEHSAPTHFLFFLSQHILNSLIKADYILRAQMTSRARVTELTQAEVARTDPRLLAAPMSSLSSESTHALTATSSTGINVSLKGATIGPGQMAAVIGDASKAGAANRRAEGQEAGPNGPAVFRPLTLFCIERRDARAFVCVAGGTARGLKPRGT